jgi:hypothetical protein
MQWGHDPADDHLRTTETVIRVSCGQRPTSRRRGVFLCSGFCLPSRAEVHGQFVLPAGRPASAPGFNHQPEAIGSSRCPPGLAADGHRVTPCHEPIAVVLHLVHSVGAGGRKTHEGGRQRFNKLETLPCVVSAGASATAEKANYGQSKLFRRAAKRSARLIIRHAQPPPVVAFAEDVTEQADLPDRADDLQFLYQGISARPFCGRPRAASGVMPKMEELRLTSVRSLAGWLKFLCTFIRFSLGI